MSEPRNDMGQRLSRVRLAGSLRRHVLIRIGLCAMVVVLAGVLGWGVSDSARPGLSAGTPPQNGVQPWSHAVVRAASPSEARARDDLAARPMPDTGTGNAYGSPQLSTRDPGSPIRVPIGSHVDRLGVATGYPQTPEGALAQLAAIDVAALGSGSLPGVRAVIQQWAAPGGPTTQTWSGVRAMASLLESTGVSGAGSSHLRVVLSPIMGLIKGTVGNDFAVVCVDFTIDITLGGTTRTAAVDCQRMVWAGDRWLIGPGPEPAVAPSVWPDTDAAISAGYRDLDPVRPRPLPGQAS